LGDSPTYPLPPPVSPPYRGILGGKRGVNPQNEICTKNFYNIFYPNSEKKFSEKIYGKWKYLLLKKNIMKKVIRLTESDLTRIVKRVINESNDGPPKKNDPTEKVTYPGIKTKGGGYFIKPWTHDIHFKKVDGKKLYWLQFEGETGEWLNYESWVKKLTDSYIGAFNKAYGKSQGTFGHG
jgi:hypothetical protein